MQERGTLEFNQERSAESGGFNSWLWSTSDCIQLDVAVNVSRLSAYKKLREDTAVDFQSDEVCLHK